MSNLLENINIPSCMWFEAVNKRNGLASIISGFLFFIGWWIVIDAASVHPGTVLAGYHVCGVLGTLSLVMVNAVSNSQIQGDAFEGGRAGPRIWLFLGFVLGFAAVIASCWILFADFVAHASNVRQWPGVAVFLQNALIFISSLIYKFGRSEEIW